ncbi:MAG TPA: AI-2E family transporter [Marmoricola sp.]|nr:AI-2E family transporter [Marmoricola sp.]
MTDEPVPEPAAPPAESGPPEADSSPYGEPGPPLEHTPFYMGLLGGLGFAVAYWLATRFLEIGSVLILVVVALFLAAGLNPIVEYFMGRGLKRPWALLVVIAGVLVTLALFILAIVPVVTDQITTITDNAPDWLDKLAHNKQIQDLNDQYDIVDKAKEYITSGNLAKAVFGGALNVGLKVLSLLGNIFVVIVLTLYFLASLPKIKTALYRLAPESRRDRVSKLGDQIVRSIGGYVSGAFVIAMCAGISTLVFLVAVGLGQYAVALALVVAILDVIPMIGATLGAVIVCAIAFATDPTAGFIGVIFYIAYQQIENYVIYPRVMSRSVEIPGAMTVIAALIGAALLGVVGALLAIPTAAAILLIVREVWVRRQDAR